jgi:K+-transporting ATPase ATPase C chain
MTTITESAAADQAGTEPSGPTHPVTWTSLRRQAVAGLRLLVVLTVLLGVLYPLGIWVVSRTPGLHEQAEGSLTATGSTLIGIDPVPANPAADPWFHTRPSASAPSDSPAGLGPADPSTSGGSNLAADSDRLRQAVDQRRSVIADREGVAPGVVPPDAVTASGSGLDPEISPNYAAVQVPRVARVTGLGEDRVRALVAQATRTRSLGLLGQPAVNVPTLNALIHAAAPAAR